MQKRNKMVIETAKDSLAIRVWVEGGAGKRSGGYWLCQTKDEFYDRLEQLDSVLSEFDFNIVRVCE